MLKNDKIAIRKIIKILDHLYISILWLFYSLKIKVARKISIDNNIIYIVFFALVLLNKN
jgi:hypothetical protein